MVEVPGDRLCRSDRPQHRGRPGFIASSNVQAHRGWDRRLLLFASGFDSESLGQGSDVLSV